MTRRCVILSKVSQGKYKYDHFFLQSVAVTDSSNILTLRANTIRSILLASPTIYTEHYPPVAFLICFQAINMKFTFAIASTILALATGINAAPASIPQITLKIFNDQTGSNAAATVPADNVPRNINDLFRGTAIDSAGNIFGTSAQLTAFTDGTKCSLVNVNIHDWVIELDGRAKNFVDLDGDNTKAVPVWLGGFTFQCSQA